MKLILKAFPWKIWKIDGEWERKETRKPAYAKYTSFSRTHFLRHGLNKQGINTHLVFKLFRKVQCGIQTLGMFNLVPQFSKEVQFGHLR